MQDDYGFIIIGGGSAGAVLAARLSKDAEARRDFRTVDTPQHGSGADPDCQVIGCNGLRVIDVSRPAQALG